MMPRLTPVVLLALALLVPVVQGQGALPPADAERIDVADHALAHWVGAEPNFVPGNATFEARPNDTVVLWFGLERGNVTNATLVAVVNVSSETLALAERTARVTLAPEDEGPWAFANLTATTPMAPGNATYAFTVELFAEDANGTTLLGSSFGSGSLIVESAPAPAPVGPEGVPMAWLVWGGAAVVVAGGAAAIGLRQRAIRRRMNAAPRRSRVMRELEMEERLERASAKRPEEAAAIHQEIRSQETVREKRRELQILEAKRADALKTLDLLKKRHETGGLTKLQYENMAAKKRVDLARIEAEIAQMEGRDDTAASSA